MKVTIIGASCAALLAIAVPVLAGTCYLDDPNNNTPLQSPIQCGGTGNDFGASPTLCGHEIHGSSCIVQVNVDSNGSNNADCLSIGAGVTLEMQDNTIECLNAAAPCGVAITVTNSGGAGNQVKLNSGNIIGCWNSGIIATGGNNATVEDFMIDLLGGDNCTGNGNFGIGKAYGAGYHGYGVTTVSHTTVENCDDAGIVAGEDVTGSLVRYSGIGFSLIAGAFMDTCVAHDNTNALKGWSSGTPQPIVQSTVLYGNTCSFRNWVGACNSSGFDLRGTNFDNDGILF